jgi:hypothetical protein
VELEAQARELRTHRAMEVQGELRAAAFDNCQVRERERVETPLPSNSPHDHMILRVDLVDSHGRWKRPCLQTAHSTM